MVAIGSEVAVLSAGAFNLLNSTAMNLLDFGAHNDGTNPAANTTAFINAFAALPSTGGVVIVPAGVYSMTTGITYPDKPVLVVGDWGMDQLYSSGDLIRASTVISTSFNGVGVNMTCSTKTSIPSLGSGLMNIGILCTGAGASQVGLRIDNRGSTIQNVEVANAGLDNIQVFDCVGSKFDNVFSHRATRHNWYLDPTLGSGALCAVTNNTFINCHGNGISAGTGNGFRLRGQVWGCNWFGGLVQNNGGYGLFLEDDNVNGPRFNRFFGMWDELNIGGSVRFDDNNTSDNEVRYTRYSSGAPFHPSAGDRNLVTGSNISLVGNAQRQAFQMGDILTSPLDTADIDALRVRARDDSDAGSVVSRTFISTLGTAVAAGVGTNTLPVPQGVDSYNVPYDRGVTWRNQANNANIQGIHMGDIVANALTLDGASTAGLILAKSGSRVGFYGTTPVVRDTGWMAATNTKTKTTFDTTTVTLPVLAAHVGALIDVLINNGMISLV